MLINLLLQLQDQYKKKTIFYQISIKRKNRNSDFEEEDLKTEKKTYRLHIFFQKFCPKPF